MIETKLILFEGVPGSGKSTLAQTILRRLVDHGVSARWWYEEEAHHPVYIFQDQQSLRRRLDQLSGQYREVIADALEQWRRFVESARAAEDIVLIDGCLFGYLTWSFFPLGIPETDIHAYLVAAERIIAPLFPCLIYLYQEDIARSLRRVFASRGSAIERRYTRNVEESPYGAQRGLLGFDGLVRYWTDYRAFLDTALTGIHWPTLAMDTTEGEWRAYERQALGFLDLPPADDEDADTPTELGRFVGTYRGGPDMADVKCTVHLEGGSLSLDGMPETWPRSRLLPRGPGVFDVASFPIEIRFTESAAGTVDAMTVTGPRFLGGSLPNTFEKEQPGGDPAAVTE